MHRGGGERLGGPTPYRRQRIFRDHARMLKSGVVKMGFFETFECPYSGCKEAEPSAVDQIICISLQEQARRYEAAARHFHDVGLCRHVTFYRPLRSPKPFVGCWESHAQVARYCLEKGAQRALILEDDVHFHRPWRLLSKKIDDAIHRLPPDWRGLYVGHLPRKAYFIKSGLLRTMSRSTHAYVANQSLLRWLADTRPFDATIPFSAPAIDGALQVMQGMYALFPMAATQRITGESFHATKLGEWLYLFRFAEMRAAVLSLWHYLTFPDEKDNPPYAVETMLAREAKRVLAAGIFDEEFYLSSNPDVAANAPNALSHYILYGRGEGRAPNGRPAGLTSPC